MKRVIFSAVKWPSYKERFLARRKQPNMIDLANLVVADTPENSRTAQYLYDNRRKWLKLLQNNFVKPDCCRYAAFISLLLDAFEIYEYDVYEGYANPSTKLPVDHEAMLNSDNPLINHVWLVCQGMIFETFNNHLDISKHNAAARIYPNGS